MNDIPVNELKMWIEMESERFRNPVFRLFHAELETVYEEFNMYQDMDDMRLNNALMKGLFPTHPLGRSVIGLPEHLKKPFDGEYHAVLQNMVGATQTIFSR